MGRNHFDQNWIKTLFDDFVLWCTDDDTEWQFGKKLSEKAGCASEDTTGLGHPVAEAVAVYNCKQVKGPSVGMEAIVKVRMQVPPEHPASRYPRVREALPLTDPYLWTWNEVNSLSHFSEKGCKVTPKLLHIKQSLQEWSYMPVPNGYVVLILMEKVPGVPLVDFWNYDPNKRQKIRAAFREGLTELFRYHGWPMDKHLGNIMYDEKRNKCWFVDYEHIYVNEQKPPKPFTNDDYFLWGLAIHGYRDEEQW